MKVKTMLAFLFLLTGTAMAKEQRYRVWGPTGNSFMATCKAAIQKIDNPDWQGTKQEAHDSGYCMGFVSGVAETMNEEEGVDFSDSAITRDQLVRVVQKYMEDHQSCYPSPHLGWSGRH
jgi:hypothetical protein